MFDFFWFILWLDFILENFWLLVKIIKEDKVIVRKCFDRVECLWRGSMFFVCFCLVYECNWFIIYLYFFVGVIVEFVC